MATVVLTVRGDDRSGLVDAVASVIAQHGGSWSASHMAQLAGKFAGIVVASVPNHKTDALADGLHALEVQGLLDVTMEVAESEPQPVAGTQYHIELIGQDRPGILRELSHALAEQQISIEELRAETKDAPMSGGTLFEATARVLVPAEVPNGHAAHVDEIEVALGPLLQEFMMEITPLLEQ